MARKIEWLIKIDGLTYGRHGGVKPGDTMEVGDEISENDAARVVANGFAYYTGQPKPRPYEPGIDRDRVIREFSERNAASAKAAEGRWR
jgi:hypothetical protein